MAAKRKKLQGGELTRIMAWPGGRVHEVAGFRTACMYCGIKSKVGNSDIALLACDTLAAAAAVYTTNLVCAAPVFLSRMALHKSKGRVRAVVINSGNANACTGVQGERDAAAMARLTAKGLGCKAEQIQVCSTGIIGHHLPMQKVGVGIAELTRRVRTDGEPGDFARAILTTDTVPKTAACTIELDGVLVRIAGATKGAGMIAPRMATTLGFIVTDAVAEPKVLQTALSSVAAETYNCMTIDGDTSTNDTLILMASGKAGNKPVKQVQGPAYAALRAGLYWVCDSLARQIAADGEGATHTITLFVGGARSHHDAVTAARAIAESPLVKTAIAGCDPNWGRIMAAAGRSGATFDPAAASLTVQGVELFRAGTPTKFDAAEAENKLKERDVSIVLMLGDGPGSAKFYTCDLTKGYVEINAAYHT